MSAPTVSEVTLWSHHALPPPSRARFIIDRVRMGWDEDRILKEIPGSRPTRKLLRRVMSDPAGFNPLLDQVAIDRAYRGNRADWLGLTHYERAALVDTLMERALAGTSHVSWPGRPVATHGNGFEQGWLSAWCESVGEEAYRFFRLVDKRRAHPTRGGVSAQGFEVTATASTDEALWVRRGRRPNLACMNGHERTDENTYWNAQGRRTCMTCTQSRGRAYRAKTSA